MIPTLAKPRMRTISRQHRCQSGTGNISTARPGLACTQCVPNISGAYFQTSPSPKASNPGFPNICLTLVCLVQRIARDRSFALSNVRFDHAVLRWVREALHESHHDEQEAHTRSLSELKAAYDRLQKRLDAMYIDKLDGRIESAFYEAKALE